MRDEERPGEPSFEWFALRGGLEDRNPKSKAARAWRAASEIELHRWIRLHPGTRPQCWWAFDSPEPYRRLVRGRGTPLSWEVVCGRATHWREASRDAAIESQASFLKRHALMTGGEASRVPAAAYEPEPVGEQPFEYLPDVD